MKYQPGDSYKVDENTRITDLFNPEEEANYDSVICEVDGRHPAEAGTQILNRESQKSYYVLEGSGSIRVGSDLHDVGKGEWVYVPEKTTHFLEGHFRALILTSPPFDPDDETPVKE